MVWHYGAIVLALRRRHLAACTRLRVCLHLCLVVGMVAAATGAASAECLHCTLGRKAWLCGWHRMARRHPGLHCQPLPPPHVALPYTTVDEKPWSHRYSEENLAYKEECDYWCARLPSQAGPSRCCASAAHEHALGACKCAPGPSIPHVAASPKPVFHLTTHPPPPPPQVGCV